MILTQRIEISTACLLRTMFLFGAAFSIFIGPQELAQRQWLDVPLVRMRTIVTAPPPLKMDESKIEDYISPKIKKAEQQLHPHILTVSKKHRIDPALVKAVILVESGYDAKAVSPRGAKGLMQLMPHIIKSFGIKDAFDPILNINAGVGYLSQLLQYFEGNVYLGLAAYNAGIGRVTQPRPIPSTTRQFVLRVLEFYEYYRSGVREKEAESEDC